MSANEIINKIKIHKTVWNFHINVADWETEMVKFAGETAQEAEKYAVMAGFDITAPTVKASTTGVYTAPGAYMPASGEWQPPYNYAVAVIIDLESGNIESAEWVR